MYRISRINLDFDNEIQTFYSKFRLFWILDCFYKNYIFSKFRLLIYNDIGFDLKLSF